MSDRGMNSNSGSGRGGGGGALAPPPIRRRRSSLGRGSPLTGERRRSFLGNSPTAATGGCGDPAAALGSQSGHAGRRSSLGSHSGHGGGIGTGIGTGIGNSPSPVTPIGPSHHGPDHCMFTPTGQVMSSADRSEYCRRKGLCESCGVRTHNRDGVGLLLSRPVTNAEVYGGICRRCQPRRVRGKMERDGVVGVVDPSSSSFRSSSSIHSSANPIDATGGGGGGATATAGSSARSIGGGGVNNSTSSLHLPPPPMTPPPRRGGQVRATSFDLHGISRSSPGQVRATSFDLHGIGSGSGSRSSPRRGGQVRAHSSGQQVVREAEAGTEAGTENSLDYWNGSGGSSLDIGSMEGGDDGGGGSGGGGSGSGSRLGSSLSSIIGIGGSPGGGSGSGGGGGSGSTKSPGGGSSRSRFKSIKLWKKARAVTMATTGISSGGGGSKKGNDNGNAGGEDDDDQQPEGESLASSATTEMIPPVALDPSLAPELHKIDNVSDALQVMQNHGTDAAILTHALRELTNVAVSTAVVVSSKDADAADAADAKEKARAAGEDTPKAEQYPTTAEDMSRNISPLEKRPTTIDDVFVEITKAMKAYPGDVDLQSAGCLAIWTLTSSSSLAERSSVVDGAIEAGCVDCVIAALSSSSDEEMLACYSLGAICSLLSDPCSFVASTILDAGMLDALVVVLLGQIESASVLEWSARAVFGMVSQCAGCEHESAAQERAKSLRMIRESSLFEPIVSVIINEGPTGMQEWTFAFLLLLIDNDCSSIEESRETRVYLDKLSEIDAWGFCTRALWLESSSPRLKELAFTLLMVLRRREGDEGVNLEVAMIASKLMRTYPENSSIQTIVIPVLADAMQESEDMIAAEDGIEKLLHVMELHGKEYPPIQETILAVIWKLSEDETYWTSPVLVSQVIRIINEAGSLSPAACGILANMSLLHNVRIGEIPIELIIGHLQSCADGGCSEPRNPCRVLSNICFRDHSKVDRVIEGGGVAALVKILSDFGSNETVAADVLDTLCRILPYSKEEDKDAFVNDCKVVDAVVGLMHNYMSDEAIQVKALHILDTVAFDNAHVSRVVQDDVIAAVVSAMLCLPNSTDVQTRCCRALRNLAIAAGSIEQMFSPIEAICILVELIQRSSHDLSLQKEACGTMHALILNSPDLPPGLLEPAFSFLIGSVLDENRGGEGRPFNPELLNEALLVIDIITDAVIEAKESLCPTSDHINCLISVVYASLDSEISCSHIVEQVLSVLRNLSKDKECERDLIESGCIVTTVDAMQENEGNSEIQIMGCDILQRLSVDNLQVKFCVIESDGIEAVLNAMIDSPNNAALQTSACRALSHLTTDDESRGRIMKSGGLTVVVSAMQNFQDDAELHEAACSALCRLLTPNTEEDVIIASNVANVVLASLQRHTRCASVEQGNLDVLHNISRNSNGLKRIIASGGGIEAILSTLEVNYPYAEVIECALKALWSLAVLETNQERFADAPNGIKIILSAMMACIECSRAQKQGCGCLCALATNSRCKEEILKMEGLDAIWLAMLAHLDSESLLTEACRAVSSLAAKPDGTDMRTGNIVVKEALVDAVTTSMWRYSSSVRLLEFACLALRNISRSEGSVEMMRSKIHDLEPLLRKAANDYPSECAQRANEVLEQLKASHLDYSS